MDLEILMNVQRSACVDVEQWRVIHEVQITQYVATLCSCMQSAQALAGPNLSEIASPDSPRYPWQ